MSLVNARRNEKILQVAFGRQAGLVVVLEDVHDPHNACAILRSCDAFGVQDIYFIFNKEKPYNPAKIGGSSSSSANKWLTFHAFRSTAECYAELRKKKFKIMATALAPSAKPLSKTDFCAPRIAIVIGNEHGGLSREAIEGADNITYFPMCGMVQSFNVSVFAALCMYEAVRQRGDVKKKYTLSSSGVKKLYKDLMSR
ncbi:MAG: RNA methyltransferase [Candidatus Liptonbacteria bacterium]